MNGEEWLSDIPQQFKRKRNIEGLIRAISAELDELSEVFQSLVAERDIDSAHGAQLDMLGSIICLTRAEAMSMYSCDFTDDSYRFLLKFKMLLNTNTCTLEELYNACRKLYGVQNIEFRESQASPEIGNQPTAKPEEASIGLTEVFPAKIAVDINEADLSPETLRMVVDISSMIKRILAAGVGLTATLHSYKKFKENVAVRTSLFERSHVRFSVPDVRRTFVRTAEITTALFEHSQLKAEPGRTE